MAGETRSFGGCSEVGGSPKTRARRLQRSSEGSEKGLTHYHNLLRILPYMGIVATTHFM